MSKRLLLLFWAVIAAALLFLAVAESISLYNTIHAPKTVTFVAKNNSGVVTLNYDENFVMPADPELSGYIFCGWYTDFDCTDGNEWTPPEKLSESITVYARWKRHFQIYFFSQNGDADIAVDWSTDFVFPSDPFKSGYEFCGWYESDGTEWIVPQTELTADVYLFAEWRQIPDMASIIFDFQNGEEPLSVKWDAFAVPDDPQREGYVFCGWYTDFDCTDGNEWVVPQAQPKFDQTVYAKWIPEEIAYAVTCYPQNGDPVFCVKYTENFALPKNICREGYTFGGWYLDADCTDGSEWQPSNAPEIGVAVYAKWNKIFYVTFDFQNGAESEVVPFGKNFALPDSPSKQGYVFGGWFCDAACTDGNEWTVPTELLSDVTVYAKWQTVSSDAVFVLFDPQNGCAVEIVVWGADFALPLDPTRSGYSFGGWFCDAACTDGNEWTVPKQLDSSVTVYAKWTKLPVEATVYVYFHPQNGESTFAVGWSDDFAFPSAPTKEGYAFGGWFTDFACSDGKRWSVPEILVADVNLYAKWIALPAESVTFDEAFSVVLSLADGAQTTLRYRLQGEIYSYDFQSASGVLFDGSDIQNVILLDGLFDKNGEEFVSSDAAPQKGDEVTLVGTLKRSGSSAVLVDAYVESVVSNGEYDDGTTVFEDVSLDENFVGWNTSSVIVADATALQLQMKNADCAVSLPSVGDYDCLVVPVSFSDAAITSSDLSNIDIAFNGTAAQTGWQSVSTYYAESSYGKLNLSFDILGYNVGAKGKPYVAEYSCSYYGKYDDGASVLLGEILSYLSAQSIDLSHYDANGDGIIDAVYIVFAASGDNDESIWQTQVCSFDGSTTFRGLAAGNFAMCSLRTITEDVHGGGNILFGAVSGLKVNATAFIRQTGTLLGLTDYNDHDAQTGSARGLGGADMMDMSLGDHGTYSKLMLGWIEPQIVASADIAQEDVQGVASGQSLTIEIDIADLDRSNDCVVVMLSGEGIFGEYLLIDLYSATGLNEARSSLLFDGESFGARLFVVSSTCTNPFADDGFVNFEDNDNSVTSTPLITMVEADGRQTDSLKNNGLWASADDLWQTGGSLDEIFGGTEYGAASIGWDISFVEVTASTVTVTVTKQ